ncbi:hypothetical protein A9Z61_11785 [Moraxella osloensis]|jgi:hypothetical protein|uniref:Lipoprotein n=1 Tax=Salmonella typhimurium TaxID=90371 RepID=A0A6C8YX80_SALTM|nr:MULTISPECIES: hypothetical protein [Moraxella]EBK2343923.1 hypothetical protein [Salmonella enterica subsp. enterica serovar Enteritidis]MIT52514.1 hypothetical protein [Salmonella enterica subsp. enterica serovar Typhimurium]OBX56447.1 hypothetical protein A9Z61_11785 [Moraxella osloensis]ONG39671.1 hypothetical protein BKE17_04695 [Enhydrobacter sp. H5]
MKTFFRIVVFLPIFALVGCASKVEKEFMQGCNYATGGMGEDVCKCVYDKIEDDYGEKVLEKMGETGYVPNDFNDKLFKYAAQCDKN